MDDDVMARMGRESLEPLELEEPGVIWDPNLVRILSARNSGGRPGRRVWFCVWGCIFWCPVGVGQQPATSRPSESRLNLTFFLSRCAALAQA